MIKVMLADDNSLSREGLRRLLGEQIDIQCVGVAESADQIIDMLKDTKPDLLIIDISMLATVDTIIDVKKCCPGVRILILTLERGAKSIISCMRAGADGYMLKETPAQDLLGSIRIMNEGEAVFNMSATASVLRSIGSNRPITPNMNNLHERELEILHLISRGLTNRQISQELGIAERTVAVHVFNLFRKLGVQSRAEAVLIGVKLGFIDIS